MKQKAVEKDIHCTTHVTTLSTSRRI